MKLLRVAQRCVTHKLHHHHHHHQLGRLQFVKSLSTDPISGSSNDEIRNTNSFESTDDSERRTFEGFSGDSLNSSLFRKLDMLRNARDEIGMDDRYNDGLSTLTDGLDGKLKKAATDFEVNEDELLQEDYTYRADMNFEPGMTYTPKDLDLRKPGVWKPAKRDEFEVTTEEVLRKADFRNVRFLANFLTDAGIIIKRSKTGISAKAQRKIAREIKTARAFGLLPFTTMGTKAFVPGRTMEDLDEDFMFESYDNRGGADGFQDPI